MAKLEAGRMDRRITVQRATLTYDALNNPTETWADLATVWASKLELQGTERLSSQEVGADMVTMFRIRWSPTVEDVNPKDRISFNSNTYNILSVTEIGRREGLEISSTVRTD